MPLKLNVGLTKKIGLPNYSSLGASCNVELELDQSLIVSDLDGFQDRVRRTFVACRQAVDDELARLGSGSSDVESADPAQVDFATAASSNGNGAHRNGAHRNGDGHRASNKQLAYTEKLAGQIKGLGIRRLESLAEKMFFKPLADLSSLDASGLIDVLKDIKAGTIDLAAALDGATS
jgi:hypothetical protein